LPESVVPELSTAVFVDGVLIVTVPKADYDENIAEAIGGSGNTLLLVQ
jgi:HSP20 family molecular chaperone IbpA